MIIGRSKHKKMLGEWTVRSERSHSSNAVVGRNAAWAVAQVIVSTIILFVPYYFVVRAVGVDGVGLLSLVSTMTAAARISELGLSGAVTRFLPEHLARGQTIDAAQVVVTATVALGLATGVVAIIAWPALNAILPLIIDDRLVPEARSLVPMTLLSLWLNLVSACVVMSLDGVNRADRRAQITVMSQVVFAVVAVLTIRRLGVIAIPVAQAVACGCLFLLTIPILYRELPEIMSARPTFACFRRIWRYGAHVQLITLLVLFYDPVTRLLLNHFGSLSAVGNFDLANCLIGQVRSLVVSANQVMVPHYSNVNIASPEMIGPTVRANFQVLMVASTMIFSMLSVSLFLIGNIWIGQNHDGFIKACLILIVGHFINSLSVGIYFMNMGVGAVLNNVVMWVVQIVVSITGGILGGLVVGTLGVLASVSAALVCASFVVVADYLRKYDVPVRTLASTTALRFAAVGAIVFMVAILTASVGLPIANGVGASLAPIVLGGSIWVCFVFREAIIAGQSPLLWARSMIASLGF